MTDQTETARFRHRTPEIEAVQWTGTNADALRAFCGPDFEEVDPEDRVENPDASAAVRESKHGTWRGLEPGYWVVKIGEEFYEESPADFAAQFEPVPSAVPAPAADLIEEYLRFLRGHGPQPDLSALPPDQREAIAGQLEVVRALADRDPELPPLDRDPVARRLGLLPACVDRATALNEAADVVAADTGFHIRYGSATDYANHYAALLRRMAVEARDGQTTQGDAPCSTADKAAAQNLTPTEYRARSHQAAMDTIRTALPNLYAHVALRVEDALAPQLPTHTVNEEG